VAAADRADFTKEANKYIESASMNNWPAGGSVVKHALLCGWREEWDESPERFEGRFRDVAGTLPQGSTFTCFNVHEPKVFAGLLSDAFTSVGDGVWSCKDSKVLLKHRSGDSVIFKETKALFEAQPENEPFSTAIVLGSMAGIKLPSHSRDGRVMSICLILRKLSRSTGPLHVIAENSEDQTAMLSMAPRTGGGQAHDPDFVNTQAIIARSLAMNMAYPQIQDALADLIGVHATSAEIVFVSASALGLVGSVLPFGAAAHLVHLVYHGRAVALGRIALADLSLAPRPDEDVEWTANHRLVCFRRSLGPPPGTPLGSSI
jgi:hypothetical protein